MCFMSVQIASINITLTFTAKKIGDFKIMEGVPLRLQSVLFTLINPLLSSCIFHEVTGTAWLLRPDTYDHM